MTGAKTVLALAASGLAMAAFAQPPAPPPNQGQSPQPAQPQAPAPQQQPQQTVEVGESELDTFTTIYVEVREISEEYESRMQSAQDAEEAQRLQAEMRDAGVEAIEDHGWTQQQYAETARAINADQALLEEAMALIEQKSS